MATVGSSVRAKSAPVACPGASEYPTGGLKFDLVAALLAGWFIFGLYLDGWAHNNLPGKFETFLTPWHWVLYSGFFAASAFHIFHQARNMKRGYAFTRALPKGYWLSLIGIAIFGFGGGFDFVWHGIFGFEENMEALLSPAHLVLATGGVLVSLGPLRAAWERSPTETMRGWAGLLPALFSLFLLLNVLTFFSQYAHFITNSGVFIKTPTEGFFYRHLLGVTSVLIPTALYMGILLLALRCWEVLPVGTLALLIGGNTLLMFWMSYLDAVVAPWPVVGVVVGSMAADGLLWWLKPSAERLGMMRVFALSVPVILFGLYFLVLLTTEGMWWSLNMWLGVTFNAGVVGLFMSYLVFPPPVNG